MTEYRIARSEELEDCIELINYVFSTSHRPHDFEQLLPKVYQAGAGMAAIHRVAVDDRGRLRALIAVLPETVMAAGKKLRTGYVGSVAVHPKARGEGHMKRLMGDWLKELEGKADLLVLDGQRQRYGYFGFEPGSVRYVFTLDEANVRHGAERADLERITFKPLFEKGREQADAAFIKKLQEAKPSYVVREADQMQAVCSTFGETALGVYVDGEMKGYLLCSGPGQITEMGCPEEAGAGTVAAAYMVWRGIAQVDISVPVYERKQVEDLAALAEDCCLRRCGSGLYRILDYGNVLEAYLTLKARTMDLAPGTFSAVLEDQPVTVRWDGEELEVRREAGEDSLILDRSHAHELLLSFQSAYGSRARLSREEWQRKVPQGWFPLPVYWSMADEF